MNIGEVSKHLNMTKKAINLYEQKGLLTPNKDDNGYRNYSNNEINILQQIKILRTLDFSINEIDEILLKNNYHIFDYKLDNLKIEEYELQKKIEYLDLIKNDFIDHTVLDNINNYQELLKDESKEEVKDKNLYVDFERIFLYILLVANVLTFSIMDMGWLYNWLLIIILLPIWIVSYFLLKYPQSRNYFYKLYRKIKGE